MREEEQDHFFKQLPFTLPLEQASPKYVIFGTGLQECLIAAHLSKIQKIPGLILDLEKTYGSCLKTVSIKELISLNNRKDKVNLYEFLSLPQYEQKNKVFTQQILSTKGWRGYNIDLEPNFFFGNSVTCDMLKQADMDKYMDFRFVDNMLHFDGKMFKNVPLSKGKIFQSKDLGLLEKKILLNTFHSLIQIYNKYKNVQENQNSTKQFDKQFGKIDEKLYNEFLSQKDNHFVPFLSKVTKNNKKIMDFIIYILCNYQHNYQKQIPQHIKQQYTLSRIIQRFGKFVRSCGIYGQGPYLYVDNGIGDVPQAFSRTASLHLSTFILHPKIQIKKIEQAEQKLKIYTNLCPQGPITTQHIYYGPSCYNLIFENSSEDQYNKQLTLRVILLCNKLNNEEECPSIVYLLNQKQCENPVYVFMLDAVSHTCPQGKIMYQFQTVIKEQNYDDILKKVQSFIEIMKTARGEQFQNSVLYVAAYVREKRYPKEINKINQKFTILRDHTGIDLDSHFVNFKKVVGEQPRYFRKQKVEGENQEQNQWGYESQALGLIQRLDEINLNQDQKQNEEVQKQTEQVKQQTKIENDQQKKVEQQKIEQQKQLTE